MTTGFAASLGKKVTPCWELFFEVEGKQIRVGPGEVIALPSSIPHSAWTSALPARAVDAWSPPRTDLLVSPSIG
jgi:hypothetical protein